MVILSGDEYGKVKTSVEIQMGNTCVLEMENFVQNTA